MVAYDKGKPWRCRRDAGHEIQKKRVHEAEIPSRCVWKRRARRKTPEPRPGTFGISSRRRAVVRAAMLLIFRTGASLAIAQCAHVSPDHLGMDGERGSEAGRGENFPETRIKFDKTRTTPAGAYIDLGESHNQDARWPGNAQRRASSEWGFARSGAYTQLVAAPHWLALTRPQASWRTVSSVTHRRLSVVLNLNYRSLKPLSGRGMAESALPQKPRPGQRNRPMTAQRVELPS